MSHSSLGWIVQDSAAAREVEELLAGMGEEGTEDELGFGVARDFYSNRFFPGLNTQMGEYFRYLILVPALLKKVATGRQVEDSCGRFRRDIRKLRMDLARRHALARLRTDDPKRDPYDIFKTCLGVFFEIGKGTGLKETLDDLRAEGQENGSRIKEALFRLGETALTSVCGGQGPNRSLSRLTQKRERDLVTKAIRERCPDSLLFQLVERPNLSAEPWKPNTIRAVPKELSQLLTDAFALSVVAMGANCVYFNLLGEYRNAVGPTAEERVQAAKLEQRTLGWLTEWLGDRSFASALTGWQTSAPFGRIPADFMSPRMQRLQVFCETFVAMSLLRLPDGDARTLINDAKNLVVERERTVKAGKRRLGNDGRQLQDKEVGSDQPTAANSLFNYRWDVGSRLVAQLRGEQDQQ